MAESDVIVLIAFLLNLVYSGNIMKNLMAFTANPSVKKREELCAPQKSETDSIPPLAERWLNADELAEVRRKVGKLDLTPSGSNLFKAHGL